MTAAVVIVKGVAWATGSRYGRFGTGIPKRDIMPWWSAACATALRRMREAHGPGKAEAVKNFKESIRQGGKE